MGEPNTGAARAHQKTYCGIIESLGYSEEMERRFGMDDAATLLVGMLGYYQWPIAALSMLEQMGHLDRREALESLRSTADTMLADLERWAGEMRECLRRRKMVDEGDAPPALRKVVRRIVDAFDEGHHPSGRTVWNTTCAVEDLAGWYSLEGTVFTNMEPGDEHAHFNRYDSYRASMTENLLDHLVSKDTLRNLLARLRGEGRNGQ